MTNKNNQIGRKNRHRRIRKKVVGTSERPRLCVFRSLKNMYAQLADDGTGHVVVAVSSLNPEVKGQAGSKTENATLVGKLIGEQARQKGIEQVVFDRGGYKYHGRVKALADAARGAGLKF